MPPHVRDDAYAPLAEAGWREEYTISDFQNVKYLCVENGYDNPNQIETAHEIRFCAHAFWHSLRPSARRERRKIDQTNSPVG